MVLLRFDLVLKRSLGPFLAAWPRQEQGTAVCFFLREASSRRPWRPQEWHHFQNNPFLIRRPEAQLSQNLPFNLVVAACLCSVVLKAESFVSSPFLSKIFCNRGVSSQNGGRTTPVSHSQKGTLKSETAQPCSCFFRPS